MKVALAEALLRRKELQQKVDQLKTINHKDLYEIKGKRAKVTDDVDDIVMQVPLLMMSQVTAAYDWHARRLRQVDSAIQQANWETTIEIPDTAMDDYQETLPVRKIS